MTEILVLRLVHVLGGTFWVGSGLFTGLFLMPALVALGPAATQVMANLQQRRLFMALPVVAVLTILSGLRLMWLTSGGFAAAYFASPRGATFAASGAAAIVAFLLAMFIARPATVRATALMATLPGVVDENARLEILSRASRLRQRGGNASRVTLWLLIVSAAGMAIARYVH